MEVSFQILLVYVVVLVEISIHIFLVTQLKYVNEHFLFLLLSSGNSLPVLTFFTPTRQAICHRRVFESEFSLPVNIWTINNSCHTANSSDSNTDRDSGAVNVNWWPAGTFSLPELSIRDPGNYWIEVEPSEEKTSLIQHLFLLISSSFFHNFFMLEIYSEGHSPASVPNKLQYCVCQWWITWQPHKYEA